MTLAEAEKGFIEKLKPLYDNDEAKDLVLHSIMHVLNVNRSQLLLRRNELLDSVQLHALESIISELQTGKPFQYVTGETEFYGLKFRVSPAVLIPRPETEELVQWILKDVQNSSLIAPLVLDIGTGSGCIAIALKKNLPDSVIDAVDVSTSALDIASINAQDNEAEVNFLQSDIFTAEVQSARYSIIVSNPPYITQSEKRTMHSNVLDFEPHTALFVKDEDPLIFYRRIAEFARLSLIPGGKLFFEINEQLGSQTSVLLAENGFVNIQLRHDMQGKDRMIQATLPTL